MRPYLSLLCHNSRHRPTQKKTCCAAHPDGVHFYAEHGYCNRVLGSHSCSRYRLILRLGLAAHVHSSHFPSPCLLSERKSYSFWALCQSLDAFCAIWYHILTDQLHRDKAKRLSSILVPNMGGLDYASDCLCHAVHLFNRLGRSIKAFGTKRVTEEIRLWEEVDLISLIRNFTFN